jgi:hypothetical protein
MSVSRNELLAARAKLKAAKEVEAAFAITVTEHTATLRVIECKYYGFAAGESCYRLNPEGTVTSTFWSGSAEDMAVADRGLMFHEEPHAWAADHKRLDEC